MAGLDDLAEYIDVVLAEVTKRQRTVHVSDGTQVQFGCLKHIKDLERRIADLTQWRDRHPRGSETRANYARLLNRLKGELAAAKRAGAKSMGLPIE